MFGNLFDDGWSAPEKDVLQLLEWPLTDDAVIHNFDILSSSNNYWNQRYLGIITQRCSMVDWIHVTLPWNTRNTNFPTYQIQLGSYGAQLTTLEIIVSEPTVFGLVTEEQFSLILIACLMMVFQESAFGVIRQLEYAYRLPESCKRDPEYVAQMDNLLNGHIRHTAVFLSLTVVTTTVALGFHSVC